jgi:hypothetical protein
MLTARTVDPSTNPGRFRDPDRAAAMGRRSGAIRRARRNRARAAALEAKAGRYLSQAAELRRQSVDDLAAAGIADP